MIGTARLSDQAATGRLTRADPGVIVPTDRAAGLPMNMDMHHRGRNLATLRRGTCAEGVNA